MANNNNTRYPLELTTLQRGLVDNCLEEGQYETAIATLDQLRSPDFNPHAPHLRQLIYISLQSMLEPKAEYEIDPSVQASPSKLVKQRQQQVSSNFISAKAVVDAQKLLMAYTRTNAPSVLSRALPRRRSPLNLSGLSEGDSAIAKRAMLIAQCKDCWQLLHSDSILHRSALPSTPRKATRQSALHGTPNDIAPVTPPTIVAEDAWPLLYWLVSLYEQDEELFEGDSNARHSPLLIEQTLDDNGRTYIDAPVNVIAYCLLQNQVQRHQLAGRLLSLLVNLTLTAEFDSHALLTAVSTRIQPEQISVLMAQLGQCTATHVLKFKVGLFQKLIGGTVLPTPGNTRPQPKMRMRAGKVPDKQASIVLDSPLLTTRPSIPTFVEILRLLQASAADMSQNDISNRIWCRYHLLLAFGSLQARLSPKDRDPDWSKALIGNPQSIIHDVNQQEGKEAMVYQCLLEIQIQRWRTQVDTVR